MTDNIIIKLERSVQEMAVDKFHAFSTGRLETIIPFDSARHAGSFLTELVPGTHRLILSIKLRESIKEYAGIARITPIVYDLKAHPRRLLRFNSSMRFAVPNMRPSSASMSIRATATQ